MAAILKNDNDVIFNAGCLPDFLKLVVVDTYSWPIPIHRSHCKKIKRREIIAAGCFYVVFVGFFSVIIGGINRLEVVLMRERFRFYLASSIWVSKQSNLSSGEMISFSI
jgi:hypothetical protein